MSDRPTFGEYFTAAATAPELTERERTFIGLAVTLTKTCEP